MQAQQKTEESTLPAPVEERGISKDIWLTLMNSVYPGATGQSVIMAWDYCKARNLDALKKVCHIVPMNVKNSKTGDYEWRDVIMPGIAESRITAFRTGEYIGQSEPVFGPMIEFNLGGEKVTAPEFCTVKVKRLIWNSGINREAEFSHTEYFDEACATKKDGKLNAMWSKRKRSQLAKCAEAGALRKAFPEELGGEHVVEEMEGKTIDMGQADVVEENEESQTIGPDGLKSIIDKEKAANSPDLKEHIHEGKTEDSKTGSIQDFVDEMEAAEQGQADLEINLKA